MVRKIRILKNKIHLSKDIFLSGYGKYYVGYVGRDNFGDDLLLDIYEKLSNEKVLPLLDMFSLQTIPKKPMILGGGTIIGGEIYLRTIKKTGLVPETVFCAGVIPGGVSDEWRSLLRNSVVYTRSEKSRDELIASGVSAVSYVDPAIFVSKIYPREEEKDSDGYIVLGVHGKHPNSEYMIEVINSAKKNGFKVIYFASSPEDIRVARRLNNKFGGELFHGWKCLRSSVNIISRAKAVVTTRLHPGICALSYRIPVKFIAYDRKHEEFTDSVKLPELLVKDTRELSEFLENVAQGRSAQYVGDNYWVDKFDEFKSIFS